MPVVAHLFCQAAAFDGAFFFRSKQREYMKLPCAEIEKFAVETGFVMRRMDHQAIRNNPVYGFGGLMPWCSR